MKKIKADILVEKLEKKGVLRTKEIEMLGISRAYLGKLERKGIVKRMVRGQYSLPDMAYSEHHTLAEAASQVPKGVVCLISALSFHGFTTQIAHEVWMAVDTKARKPAVPDIPIRIVRFSGDALVEGVEIHRVYNVEVKVFSAAKTVADCFKYRNKIGLDVALEALQAGWRESRFTMDELWKYARICRVTRIMQPYLELMVT